MKTLLICTVLCLALAACSGSSGQQPAVPPVPETGSSGSPVTGPYAPAGYYTAPGKLVRVEYSYHSGTMYGADEEFDIMEEELLHGCFFDPDKQEYVRKDNCPYDKALWAQIEDTVMQISPYLEPVKIRPQESSDKNGKGERLMVLDGGDDSLFALTWNDGSTWQRVQYYIPSDRRWRTLSELMSEAADPAGREIPFYDPPQIAGVYVFEGAVGSRRHRSFQMSLKTMPGGYDDGWYFFAYYPGRDGKELSLSKEVSEELWIPVMGKCAELSIPASPEIYRGDDRGCSLYYSDGRQISYDLSEEQMQDLLHFFDKYIETYF